MITYDKLVSAPAPTATRRVTYGKEAPQFGELWFPSVGMPRATIVFIHGGCWLAEYDVTHAAYAAHALAGAGYVVWTPEYRRVGDEGGGWPGTFLDISSSVDCLRSLARSDDRIDPQRVIFMGHSAGGHLALWAGARRSLAMLAESQGRRDGEPICPLGVVALAPISDLALYGATPGDCNASVTPFLGGTIAQVPRRYEVASPTAVLPIGVRMHLVHGARDAIVPVSMSESFVHRARSCGDAAEVTVVTEAGHFDVIAPQTAAWRAVLAAVEGIAA